MAAVQDQLRTIVLLVSIFGSAIFLVLAAVLATLRRKR